MASIRKDPRGKSPYWHACLTLPDGRRTQRTTGSTNRLEAQRIADKMEVGFKFQKQLRDKELQERFHALCVSQIEDLEKDIQNGTFSAHIPLPKNAGPFSRTIKEAK